LVGFIDFKLKTANLRVLRASLDQNLQLRLVSPIPTLAVWVICIEFKIPLPTILNALLKIGAQWSLFCIMISFFFHAMG
jgi:uncharacterized membrane protein